MGKLDELKDEMGKLDELKVEFGNLALNCLFVCVEVLRSSQQLKSCRAGQLPINTVPGQA